MTQLRPLQPQLIGAVFRVPRPLGIRRVTRLLRRVPLPLRGAARLLVRLWYSPLTPKTKFLLISLFASMTLLGLAEAGDVLVAPTDGDARPALAYLFSDHARPSAVSLPLLQDPAGLIVLAVVFVTPIFYCQQVRAIADFVPMNERNGGAAHLSARQIQQHNRLVARTNRSFTTLGRRAVSVAIMAVVAVGTVLLFAFVNAYGLMETWNSTMLPDAVWRSEVYAGWWANLHTHPELALTLCASGTYAFYFLTKQLAMGVVFTIYLKRSAALGFGVTPNMTFDSDGFRGLRTLRQFMLWTYGSALAHMIGLLALSLVWLPASPWMLFVVVGVMVVDTVVIIYPSSIGYHSALAVKESYVRSLRPTELSSADRDAAIAQVWSVPVLPVATRKAITGLTLYLLVPAVVALVPEVIQRL
ncbi:hypothetical protein TUSST3_80930 [Streptomyces sp. TUS-ST3]|jgi:hypothetical protein|uniref:hypothetical protein n=1 Tax=unclassified Streptomyces TaxID=2593676 RepID=UPI000F4D9FEC|nr:MULTISPECIES: hypothetical protein [unclassified Streptomyces]MDH6450862.1 hypothetical protein [Streptomyces sp. SAI-119]QUC62593.1 hypothetical protein IOD14_40770 [Streptomyces sp. A2-16]GLP71473.1 hypothetical protein TUSST3_80930 [Streptomyces sp. TUS-ST3]